MKQFKDSALSYLSLFTSAGTLICCALPALLVSLGLGATLAGIAGNVPGLIWISENKLVVFISAGALLLANGLYLWMSRNAPCPLDPKLRDACISGRKFSRIIYTISVIIYLIGFYFAYLISA